MLTAVVIGASRVGQIEDAVGALGGLEFGVEELEGIEEIVANGAGTQAAPRS